MTIATKSGGLILKDGKLATNCACCGVPSCVAGCTIPSSLTVVLSVLSPGTIFDIFDGEYVLDFDRQQFGAAVYEGPVFPGAGTYNGQPSFSQFDFNWLCGDANNTDKSISHGTLRIQRCNYGSSQFDSAVGSSSGFFNASINVNIQTQHGYCIAPQTGAITVNFDIFFATPSGGGGCAITTPPPIASVGCVATINGL
jgi:hypothetical protein